MRRPPRTDVLVAAGLAAVAVLEQALAGDGHPIVLLSLPGYAAVAWRRVHPVPASALAVAFLGAPEFFVAGSTDFFTVFAAGVLALFSVAAYPPARQARAGTALALTLLVVVSITAGLHDGVDETLAATIVSGTLFAVVVLGAPAIGVALAVRRHATLRRRLEAQALELEQERERHARAAADDERARVAEELHDVVTDAVRAMLAEVDGARAAVARDPDGAAPAILRVEERGRDALGEMRRLLGVLRRGDADLALRPQPSLARLDELSRRMIAAGLEVSVRVEGTPRPLTAGLDVAAYRVVEDALARAGSARRADVVVRWEERDVGLEVAVDGPQLADPASLAAVRERVALFSGRLESGRRPRGGSAMRAALPAGGA